MTDDDVDAYPLQWPIGWPRTEPNHRQRARFGSGNKPGGVRQLTIAQGRDRLIAQLRMLSAVRYVISTNLPVRRDGLLYADARNPADPGAAVYFQLPDEHGNMRPQALAVDKWDRLADNLAALAAHVDALRGIDRWGVGTRAQAFAGYKALAAMDERKAWWQVLGFTNMPATWGEAKKRYDELMWKHHPDRGGNPNQAAEVNAAWQEGQLQLERKAG
jgi:hypothetical protein